MVRVLQKLLITQDVFATTNYDLLLEKATGLVSASYNNPDIAFPMLDKHLSTHVLHIHGIYDSVKGIDDIIADEKQYQDVVSNQGAQFIQGILGTRTLVFVGCGKTTEDINMSRFIQFANDHLKMDKTYYFLFNSSSPVDSLPKNIVPIPYGDEYSDLTPFLEEIANERISHRINGISLIGRTAYSDENNYGDELLKYHYSQRLIPLCGRNQELERILSFVNADMQTAWWVVTGQAGSGKSRLALETLHRLPTTWFGFFTPDSLLQTESYSPFCNTLIVIDYVSGRERTVAEAISHLLDAFEKTNYKLRILLLERENTKQEGSWYAKLLQRMSRTEMPKIRAALYCESFLNLTDIEAEDVVKFIAAVCSNCGADDDPERDRMLMDMYSRKFERLQFRPLFLQLFVEAWINDEHGVPRYDSYTDILNQLLQKEQEKWLSSVEGDLSVCNAFIHLLVRANISGKLDIDNLPEYYRNDGVVIKNYIASHTFPGKQRKEHQSSLINLVCQNIDENNEFISPLFPDILKEYMFSFYMEDERLPDVMNEIWQHAAASFSNFITRCMMDFPDEPIYQKALNASRSSQDDLEALVGRTGFLQDRLIQEGEDPRVFWNLIENEYAFWHSLSVPEADTEENDIIAVAKVAGLNKVATHLGAWSLYDVSEMIDVLDEMIQVGGGKATALTKKLFLSEQIRSLATHSFSQEAKYLQNKLDELADDPDDGLDNIILMQGSNVKMMDYILQLDMKSAFEQLKLMREKCNYENTVAVKMLAHSAFNFESWAMQLGEGAWSGKALHIVNYAERLFPDNHIIRIRRIGAVASNLTFELLSGRIASEAAREKIRKLENELSQMKFNGTEDDEVLSMSWGTVKSLKMNIASEEELRGIIAEADDILRKYPINSEVVCTDIMATRSLHQNYLKTKISHAEVEKLFEYVEINYESGAVRNEFFAMLDESEDSENRDNYLTSNITRGARQDARYNPTMGSGIPEIDLESDFLWDETHQQKPYVRRQPKVGANERCPCGSGKNSRSVALARVFMIDKES